MSKERIRYLVQQYLEDRLTPEEGEEFNELFEGGAAEYREADWDPVFERIMAKADATGAEKARSGGLLVRGGFRRMRWVAAASVLFFVAGMVWLLERGRPRHSMTSGATVAVAVPVAHDADPGSSKAVLTLADGKTIALDSTEHGVIGQQGGEVLVSANKQLVYQQMAEVSGGIGYNVLTTPRGGEYTVVLPDGTKVWLNADSYLRYPTSFTGGNRVVELRGEGYFEVAARAGEPFKVEVLRGRRGPGTAGLEPLNVDVLGTHFDIMAYDDEPVLRTTLVEGAVRVSKGAAAVVLRPGQQARLEGENRLVVGQADVEEAVAWKNGLFKFDGASIGAVMRQLSRWYDLDVQYTQGEPKDLFQGELYRDVRVSELLKILQASGVHCAVEGKRLLVK
ncbi:MAG TPA: FecR domain-containing protein [Puia sp.]|nr:FecR domain-containing protein [Puia sp.]